MIHKLKAHQNIKNISIEASLECTKDKLRVTFVVGGALSDYIFPKPYKLKRADELWKATCFELMLANEDELYYELNFSPSLGWNFYALESYRFEPKELEYFEEPSIFVEKKENLFRIILELESTGFNFEIFTHYNLATILLNKQNERTFWAIKHLKIQPDFHDRDSFLEIL